MKALKVTLILLMGLSLMACGASKVAVKNGSQSSNNSGAKLYADCGGFQKSSVGTQGAVATFLNGNSYVPDLIRLKITQLNANVTGGSEYIQIFRWQENNGSRTFNNTPVAIVVQLKSTGAYLNNSAPWERISKANIDAMISANNLSAQGITAANFISYVSFVLADMDVQYQAMSLAFYNSSTAGTAAYDSVDVLLPSFDANPNTYAATRTANSPLLALHPNWAARSYGLSNQQYKDATDVYCAQF